MTATQTTSAAPAWRVAVIGAVAILGIAIGIVLGSAMLQSRATAIGSGASYVPATAPLYFEVRVEPSETQDAALRELLGQAAPPHYVAIMGYVQPSERFDRAIEDLRLAIREATKATTTFGYGPRFLHSTGQLHKGGPPTGIFLQLVHDGEEDAEIPEAGYTFGTLKNAQATGDLQTLRAHSLPVQRVRLEGDPAEAVERLAAKIKEMMG